MEKSRVSLFKYKFDQGPLPLESLTGSIAEGNCRLLLQDFFNVFRKKYFNEQELLNPAGYLYTGSFLKQGYSEDFFDGLPTGSVIYAESIRNKKGAVDKSPDRFQTKDDYLIALHTAVYIQDLNEDVVEKLPSELSAVSTRQPAIWHATAIEGCGCLWSVEKFLEYYKPVAAKQFI